MLGKQGKKPLNQPKLLLSSVVWATEISSEPQGCFPNYLPSLRTLLLLCCLVCNIFRFFFSQEDILKCACHGPDHHHTRQPSFLPDVYWVLYSPIWTEKCVYSSPCQRTAWLSMVHKNSPVPCVGKPFSFAQSRSSLHQNTETIWWHVLKENITKQCHTHDPSQQNPTLLILENQPVQSPGLPQGSSCPCVRKDVFGRCKPVVFQPCHFLLWSLTYAQARGKAKDIKG